MVKLVKSYSLFTKSSCFLELCLVSNLASKRALCSIGVLSRNHLLVWTTT